MPTLFLCLTMARAEPVEAAGPELDDQLATANLVALVTLAGVQDGVTMMSSPPQHTGDLVFEDVRLLRGSAPVEVRFNLPEPPTWTVGDRFLVAATGIDRLVLRALVPLEPELEAHAVAAAALPLHWRLQDDRPRSPWPDARPPWLAGAGLTLAVAQVPAAELVPREGIDARLLGSHHNSYGDGAFHVTITNTGAGPATVEALRRRGDEVLWTQSLLVSHQGEVLPLTTRPLPADTSPVVLEPGASVDTELDLLRLPWEAPGGGSRVYFEFALGELQTTSFFYYSNDVHGAMRARAQ